MSIAAAMPEAACDPAAISSPVSQILVKVAARCNIDCTYCYWFRDAEVYRKPKLMSAEVTDQLLKRLEEHIVAHGLDEFLVILHGGEPLLWGIPNFRRFATACEAITARTGCDISIAATTNGILINEAWLDCFADHQIIVALSIDGPAHIHDLNRLNFQGKGTHAAVMKAVRLLQSRGIPVNALSVCNPAFPARDYVDFFAEAGITRYDIMFPDATLDDQPVSVAPFYRELFDLWLEANRSEANVEIRTVVDMVMGLVGGDSMSEGFGNQPTELCTVMTDGNVEVHDVLRIAGDGSTATGFNLFDNALEDIKAEPRWRAARAASMELSETCRQCRFVSVCGGGYLPHRHSKANGYANPSAYCADLYATFEYMQAELERQIYVRQPTGERIEMDEALTLVDKAA
jgi:uncharacterized protein